MLVARSLSPSVPLAKHAVTLRDVRDDNCSGDISLKSWDCVGLEFLTQGL